MRAYQLNPVNSKSLLGVVDAEIQQGHPDKAMTFLEERKQEGSQPAGYPSPDGQHGAKGGQIPGFADLFHPVLNGLDKKSKARADLYVQIAQTYRLQGDFDASIASLQKAREILPDNEVILADLGNLMDNAGHRTEARQAYEACLRVNPNNALVLNNLAYLMAETGSDLDVALNYAQKAKGLQPNLGRNFRHVRLDPAEKRPHRTGNPGFQGPGEPGACEFHFSLPSGKGVRPKRRQQERYRRAERSPETQSVKTRAAGYSGHVDEGGREVTAAWLRAIPLDINCRLQYYYCEMQYERRPDFAALLLRVLPQVARRANAGEHRKRGGERP